MGWGYYAPCIVYGFEETSQNIISYDFLEKYDLERYALYTNKGECYNIVYGKSCVTLETINTIDTSIVDKAYEIASKCANYDAPKFMLALHGNIHVPENVQYNPE